MADDSLIIDSLIRDIRRSDPRLAQALTLLNFKVRDLNAQLNPAALQSLLQQVVEEEVDEPDTFEFIFTPRTIRFTWSHVDGAASYEVRRGTVWETASFLFRSVSLTADIDALPIGTYTFLIKSLTSTGDYSDDFRSLVVTVPAIPAVIISARVIDNNVLLFWNEPASVFVIDYYEVFKDGVSLGILDGTFFTKFEQVAGTYSYTVVAHDIVENESIPAEILVTLNQPPDFALTDTRVSNLTGTPSDLYIRTRVGDPYLIGPFISRTFRQHFDDNSWDTVQDQITAGYPLFLTPSDTTGGTYIEKIDYGVTLNSIIVTLTYNDIQLGDPDLVTLGIEMQVSLDDITYTAYTAGKSQYFASFRYLRIKLIFACADDHALLKLSNLTIRLDVKREQDGGIVSCLASDVTGTTVTFNKEFKDIDSIDVSSMGNFFGNAIVDFVDAPNPTTFKVLVFDAAGVRIDADVRWIARGIV